MYSSVPKPSLTFGGFFLIIKFDPLDKGLEDFFYA